MNIWTSGVTGVRRGGGGRGERGEGHAGWLHRRPARWTSGHGTPVICYTRDFRDQADVLRAGLTLRKRLGGGTKLLYKTDVFTLCEPERLLARGKKGRVLKTKKKTSSYSLEVGESTLKVSKDCEQALRLSNQIAVEPWARGVS